MSSRSKYFNLLMTIVVSLLLGAILILMIGENPLVAYVELFKGAFATKLGFGTTLQKFIPLLLTSIAFAFAARVGAFNVGVEGEMYLGAITAAWIGHSMQDMPAPLIVIFAMLGAVAIAVAWGFIPAALKVYVGVNEVCVTILLNYVAKYITSFLVNGPMSARSGVPQTPVLPGGILFTQFLKPSQVHTGIFLALFVSAFLIWYALKSKAGYKYETVGLNPKHADYVGIDSKKMIIKAMLISAAIGGFTGFLEVFGVYGYFLDNFSSGLAFDGMMAALIVKNDLKMVPFMAFFLAALKSGALGMERYTGVPKSIVDTIIAIFIIFACMEALFSFIGRRKAAKQAAAAK